MKRVQLGELFVMHTLAAGLATAMGAKAPDVRNTSKTPSQQSDLIARAEAKRARKAAKLRGAK